jgi:hypothetical protein
LGFWPDVGFALKKRHLFFRLKDSQADLPVVPICRSGAD